MRKLALFLIIFALLLNISCISQSSNTHIPEIGMVQPDATKSLIKTPSDSLTPTASTKPNSNPTPTPTPSPSPDLSSLKIIGQVGGPVQAIMITGYYACVGVGFRMVILDVSDLIKPLEISSTESFGYYVEDVAVSGDTALVAAGGSGLYTVDISDPFRPTIVGNYDSPGYAESVTATDNYAYLADGPAGLQVIDITDRTHPIEVASAYSLEYVYDIEIEGNYAYIAAAGAGLMIADVSTPVKPKEIGTIDTPGYAYGVTLAGETAFLADGWGGLRIMDVSNPGQLKEIGFLGTPGWALDVAVDENTLYIADATYGLRVIDASDKTNLKEIGSYEISGGNAVKLAISGDTVFLADRSTGLGILNVSTPSTPVSISVYSPIGFADAVAISGNYAYIAAGPYGLRVIDISDLSHPNEIGVCDTNTYDTGVIITGKYACIIASGSNDKETGLYTIDVSNPHQPKMVCFLAVEGMPQDIVIENGIVYIANEWGLVLVDISNPASPVKLSALDFSKGNAAQSVTATWGVAVSGSMAYVTHGDKLVVVDVSNPQKPFITGFYKSSESWKSGGVTVGSNFAYLTMTPGPPLHIVDISNPKNPTGAGSFNFSISPERLIYTGGMLYIADGGAGLLALDVSNPQQPVQTGLQSLPGYALGLSAADRYIFVADGESGLFIIEDLTKSNKAAQESLRVNQSTGKNKEITEATNPPTTSLAQLDAMSKSNQIIERGSAAQTTNLFSSGRKITVTNTDDTGQGTLRWAVDNVAAGGIIMFEPGVFPAESPVTIHLTSGLTIQKSNVTIDASNSNVILDGSNAAGGTTCLLISSNGNIIKGLQIVNFPENGIQILGTNNVIGGSRGRGTAPMGEGNLISGNGGIGITIFSSSNKITGNYVGTDLTGTKTWGNKNSGLFISGGSQNIIGGLDEADRNVFGGGGRAEISFMNQANRNVIIGNYIGTDASGVTGLGNATLGSITIELGGYNNIIKNNVIGNEDHCGIIISDWGSWYNEIIGNHIGVDATGTASLGGKGSGIHINASFNRVGGTTHGERNIISGNNGQGVKIGWQSTTDVLVIGNYIGTDITGTIAIGNVNGITVEAGTRHCFIGGNTVDERNLVSGNDNGGVIIQDSADYNFILGNYLGTDITGTYYLVNSGNGIVIGGDFNFILRNDIRTLNAFKSNPVDTGRDNRWDMGGHGNYWSDYKGNDQNNDGIGDAPYAILPNGIDGYPLMKT